MKGMKRILAMLLAVVMVVGLIPATVFAADSVLDAAIFCSDLHGETANLTSILGQVKNTGVTYSSVGLVGDTCLTVSSVTSTISSALGYTPNVMFSYASSHDTENGADISTNWNYSGEVEGVSKYYLVYTIRETDMQNSSGAATAAPAFTSWYNGLTDAEKALPIFIMSHRPLHDRRDDNAGAATWYSAISAAAESSDIVFFWGHNHTSESSVDTAAYYVAKDGTETFTVYNGDTVVPNFTYMNAGYIDANGQNPARKPVATTVKITADSLIFQDYTTSGEYTNSSYSHNVTVAREFAASEPAATLTSIEVTGETEYTVGGNGLNLTVNATYDNGTTADVTAEATFEPAELTASGVYTVTASYGGLTDTIDVTVNLYDEVTNDYGNLLIAVEAFSQGATALEVTWDDAADAVLYEKDLYTDYVVYDLAVTNPGQTTKYAMSLVENMDTNNLAVYHVADDGTLTLVPHTIENDCVVFTTSLTGAFAYGVITVPEGYTLTSVTLANIPTDLFVGGSLDLMNAVITATYTKEGAEDFVRQLTVYDYDENNFSGYDVKVVGAQTAVFTYEGVSATLDIRVWGTEVTNGEIKVVLDAEGSEYGVSGVNVAASTNTNVATAIQYVITGDNYVAYDITLAYANGYSATEDTKTVTLPIPAGVTNPVVCYVSNSGTAVNMKATNNGDGTVTFTTTHFSTYVVGEGVTIETESGDATIDGTEDVTTTTKVAEEVTVYKLVTSITSGKTYLIVNSNSGNGYGLDGDTTGYATTAFTGGSDYYSTWDDTGKTGTAFAAGSDVYLTTSGAYLWTAGSNSFTIGYTQSSNGSWMSGYTYSYTLNPSSSGDDWTLNESNLTVNLQTASGGLFGGSSTYADYYLTNSGSTWGMATSGAANVYFYEPVTVYKVTEQEVTTPGDVGHTYSVEGTDITDAVAIKGQTVTLSSALYDTPDGGTKTDITASSGITPSYEVVTGKGNSAVISKIENGVATLSGTAGTAVVKVTYTSGDLVAWDEFIVTATAPDHYSIQLHEKNGDTYGNEITAPVALKGVKADDTYSVWAVVKAYISTDDTTGIDIGTLGAALHWTVSDESIATINEETGVITFTGDNYGTFDVTVSYEGADGKVITDTITISATKSQYIVPGDGTDDFPEYPNEGAVRFDKTATAVGNYSETGIAKVELSMTGVPYTTDNAMDVVVMLDMTGSMSDDGMEAAELATIAFVEKIVKNEDGSYNNNRIAVYAFNSGSSSPYELVSLKSISSDAELTTANTAIKTASNKQTSGGTPFDEAAQQCYNVLQAAKTNLPEGETTYTRQQFCVFMSDGGPTSYAGDDGDGTYTTITNSGSGTSAITTYFSGYDSSTSSSWSFTLPTEYYTNLMKADGVTVYTVGLLLQNKPGNPSPYSSMSASTYDSTTDSLTSIGSHYYFTSRVLKQMASDESKYIDIFNVDNADKATAAFEAIAQSILEAAKDVVVEDKIGSDYTINFSIPGYGTDAAVSSEALDGLTEFYIQAVEYQLDANKNRTGDPAILENFTFNSNGTLKSHTVDGVACSNCSHVTTTNGVITAIDGTYFDYKSDSTGEYLTWEADKLTTTELALQYFAYLDNSSGLSEEEIKNGQQVKPGTYYTNEYATLTYTNFHGKQVQQEFPVPQMTWNGAQVSYVFYLVNAAGQPVNTAGRVVPFSEAVYVTDIYTHNVIWNDLEQSTSLDAVYLAQNLIPDVYELYDDDASYSIHVYEDESAVNLNNHFIISGDVTDDYNKTWTNANTTYVFNTKADTAKYNAIGAYIANDGNNSVSNKTYHCKSEAIVGATYTTSVDAGGNTIYTVTSVGNGYQKVDGETQTLASSLESTTGGTVIDGYVYYVDDNGEVYTIVTKTNGSEVRDGFDFHNTTVAFAVVWKPQLEPDTVVVDFGLDVVIDVIANDAMAAGVTGVMLTAPDAETDGTYADAVGVASASSADGLWTASTIENNITSVRFHMNQMGINAPVTFYYEAGVNYYKDGSTLVKTNMYSSVTVIPATSVYYEDSFVTFTNSSKATDAAGKWTQEGTTTNKTQAVDRPGTRKEVMDAVYDADNVYGYDAAYKSMSKYSMGSAMKVTVKQGISGMASFDFYGTGFDVISMTDSTTGMILVQVFDANNQKVKDYAVNTYYGYAYGLYEATYTYTCVKEATEGTETTEATEAVYAWVRTKTKSVTAAGTNGEPTDDPKVGDTYVAYETGWHPNATDNALYQVPVIKVTGLDYGKYTAKVIASYNTPSDINKAGSYNFYLDAIRIYDPTGVVAGKDENDTDGVVSDAYIADGEMSPDYTELRNNIISVKDFDAETDGQQTAGLIFIDQAAKEYTIADYTSYGPNNEMYLANGQAVAFNVEDAATAKDIQLGIKSANGDAVTYEINGDSYTVSTATDMYYSIAKYAKAGTVVIKNVSGGILSLTNIKVTDAPAAEATSLLWMDGESATFALRFLSRSPVGDGSDTDENEGEDTTTDNNTDNSTNTNTGNTGNNGNADAEQNGTVSGETTAPESNGTVNDAPETDKPAEEQPEEELPEEETPEETPEEEIPEDSLTTGTVTEQLGFWARLWNAIKNAFKRLFTSLGF